MAISVGGQDAFQERCKRIARAEGQGTLFVGMDQTCNIGRRKSPSVKSGGLLRFAILGVVLAMPAAAYAQGLVDVTPTQAMTLCNQIMDQIMKFIA